MKTRWIALGVAVALSSGCVPTNFVVPTAPPATADKAGDVSDRPVRAQPVTAGQITSANAHEKAQALRAELDADTTAATEVNGKKDKK